MASLNLDTRAKLDLTIPEDHSYVIAIKIKDKVTQVYQEFTGIWKLVVARDEAGKLPLKTFTSGSGFNISVDLLTLTIDIPTVQNLIDPGSYFYDLRKDEGGYSTPVLKGSFTVNPVISKP